MCACGGGGGAGVSHLDGLVQPFLMAAPAIRTLRPFRAADLQPANTPTTFPSKPRQYFSLRFYLRVSPDLGFKSRHHLPWLGGLDWWGYAKRRWGAAVEKKVEEAVELTCKVDQPKGVDERPIATSTDAVGHTPSPGVPSLL